MVALGNCVLCRHILPPEIGTVELTHCYGAGDQPARRGTFGGFRCTCECRSWERNITPPESGSDVQRYDGTEVGDVV